MLAKTITAVKTALTGSGRGTYPNGLEDKTGARIFTAPDDLNINTGWPHPDLIRPGCPTVNEPVVAVYFNSPGGGGVGFREHLLRDEAVVAGRDRKYDMFSMGDLVLACNIDILAAEGQMDELVGTLTWRGYIEQALLIVREHSGILGDQLGPSVDEFAHIVWDWAKNPYEIPGTVIYAQDRRLVLATIKTEIRGGLVGIEVPTVVSTGGPVEVGAEIDQVVPHDGEFDPVGP